MRFSRCSTTSPLALHGGRPVRSTTLPYSRQLIDDRDVAAVVDVLRSDWLTTGPALDRFERALADHVGVGHAVAVSSGTAALHAALFAAGVGPGDEVVVPALTFVATASSAVMLGAVPVFVDVDPDTLLVDPRAVQAALTGRTRAIIGVDYAGRPAAYEELRRLSGRSRTNGGGRAAGGPALIADACHALGATAGDVAVGALADATAFSFHPVKSITSGEGGAVTTDHADWAARMRRFRNHGLSLDHRQRTAAGSWAYDVHDLGVNYRLGEVQCALARSQLERLPVWIERRREIARAYDEALTGRPDLRPLARRPLTTSAHHLYVVQLCGDMRERRDEVFAALRAEGIGVNVHYRPVHLLAVFMERFGSGPGDCPAAEAAARRILSLPCFPAMTDADVRDVVMALEKVLDALSTSRPAAARTHNA